jgi:hypothetical protein
VRYILLKLRSRWVASGRAIRLDEAVSNQNGPLMLNTSRINGSYSSPDGTMGSAKVRRWKSGRVKFQGIEEPGSRTRSQGEGAWVNLWTSLAFSKGDSNLVVVRQVCCGRIRPIHGEGVGGGRGFYYMQDLTGSILVEQSLAGRGRYGISNLE